MRTLDSTYMRDLSERCETCDLLADQVDGVATAGEKIEGGQVRFLGSTPPYLTGDEAHLVFDILQAPLSLTKDGAPVEGASFAEYSTSGGGGIARWDDARTTWILTQWAIQ
jgi:hypothetical protein